MKIRFLTILTIAGWLLLTACSRYYVGSESSPENLISLVRKVQPAVVTVITYDINRQVVDLGSGFFVDAQGHLITNYHVLKGAYAADVKLNDGSSYRIDLIVAENEAADLIEARVDIARARPLPWVPITDIEPAIGERVLVVGSPLGLEQTVSEGIVSAVRELPGAGKIFQLSAPISPGSSGSPVVNMKGQVVGVVSFQTTMGQNLNFAVAAKGILDLRPGKKKKTLSEWTLDTGKRTPGLAEALCKKGFDFSVQGQFKDALKYYQEATQKSPENVEAWTGLGSCYDGLDKSDEAIAAFQQAIHLDPRNPAGYFNLGRYYRKLGRYPDAVAAYLQATKIDPEHAPAYFALGQLYGKMGEYERGEEAFKQVIRIIPNHAPAYYYIGLTYFEAGRYREAVTSYQEALQINPESAPILYSLGIAFSQLGEHQLKVESFKSAIRVDPDFAPAHHQMGLFYLESGDRAAALAEYKLLKGLDPVSAEILFRKIYP